jgi:hypothetical protein
MYGTNARDGWCKIALRSPGTACSLCAVKLAHSMLCNLCRQVLAAVCHAAHAHRKTHLAGQESAWWPPMVTTGSSSILYHGKLYNT